MEKAERLVIALGGNALQSKDSGSTAEAQLSVVRETCEHIAELSVSGYEVAIVHGNGPQVGRILLASETAKEVVPAMPFDVCGATSPPTTSPTPTWSPPSSACASPGGPPPLWMCAQIGRAHV